MLYTRKGDTGTTRLVGGQARISKSSAITEALGSLDEINSFLGILKVKSDIPVSKIIHNVQQKLFIIQAEVAGAKKTIEKKHLKEIEKIIDSAEKELPPIKTFFISGGTELAANFDVARTIARRAERKVVGSESEVGIHTLAYLNRLSSLLYALARLTNHKYGIIEESPTYK